MGRKKNPNTIQNRKKSQEEYRHRVRRFTFQFSLRDIEAREWFEQQPKKGDYLKQLILADKRQTMDHTQFSGKEENHMRVNAREEEYEYVELFGKPALFTNSRIDRSTVPEGWYAYDETPEKIV